MNIEEAIKNLKVLIGLEEFNKLSYKENNAIETLLTAYEKEKETSHYIQSQLDIANAKLVEEKEKNKKAIDFINDKNNYFEDGENWQNILKIKEILEE